MTSPGSDASICVSSKNSLAVPRAMTTLPTATAGVADGEHEDALRRSRDWRPRRRLVSAGRSRSTFTPVTTPLVITSWSDSGEDAAAALNLVYRRLYRRAAPCRGARVARSRIPNREVDVVVVGIEAAAAFSQRGGRVARRRGWSRALEANSPRRSRRDPRSRPTEHCRRSRAIVFWRATLPAARSHGDRAGRVGCRQRSSAAGTLRLLNKVVVTRCDEAGKRCDLPRSCTGR